MISNGDVIPIAQFKIQLVLLQNILSAFVFSKEDLGAEETYLDFGEEVNITFKHIHASCIIEYFVSRAAFLMGNELSGNSMH